MASADVMLHSPPVTSIAKVTVTPEQMDLVKRTIAPNATPDELKLFLYDCTRRGVHPLDRMIHFTKRGGRYTAITGIDFMRSRAADTGSHAGTEDAIFTPETTGGPFPECATVTVYRIVQGMRVSFTATARWSEYYPGSGGEGFMWRKMPYTMLGKCAEALALRKGFPQELSGLYSAEEMDQSQQEAERSSQEGGGEPRPGRRISKPDGASVGKGVDSAAAATPPESVPDDGGSTDKNRKRFFATLQSGAKQGITVHVSGVDFNLEPGYVKNDIQGQALRRGLLSGLLQVDVEDAKLLSPWDWEVAADELGRMVRRAEIK
jgi:phage recombination protein Bet